MVQAETEPQNDPKAGPESDASGPQSGPGSNRKGKGLAPKSAVRRELARAAFDLAIAPLFGVPYLVRRNALERKLTQELKNPATPLVPPRTDLGKRRITIFVSAAEHSGEVHALSAVRALKQEFAQQGAPEPRFIGLGAKRLKEEGVEIVGDPIAQAAMGADVLKALPFYMELLRKCASVFRDERPDLLFPVDSPALHVPLARIAKRYGVPVVHYVTPQYWAWAPWRVRGYRQVVDLGLTILPFEPPWFARHGVTTRFVGHPQMDQLAARVAIGSSAEENGRQKLLLLPGSRRVVIRRNLPWMLRCVQKLWQKDRDIKVLLAHDDAEHEELFRSICSQEGVTLFTREEPPKNSTGEIELQLGDLHASLQEARAALSVSGTVLLDLLHHRIPTAVVYRIDSPWSAALYRRVLTVPWFSSVNLLTAKETLPEWCFAGEGPIDEVAGRLESFLHDPKERAQVRSDLDEAAQRLGTQGASKRAAQWALAFLGGGLLGQEQARSPV